MKIRNTLMCGALAAIVMLTGCGQKYEVKSEKPAEIENFDGNVKDVTPKSGDLIATFEIEDYGTIKAVLFPQAAPVGVENFQKLCDEGFYKGLKIHRVIDNFMFQGGSTNGNGTGGDAAVNGGKFGIETAQNTRHFYGALCYANASGQNTTQFYIVNNKQTQDISLFDIESNQRSINDALEDLNKNAKNASETAINAYLQQIQYAQHTVDFMKNATDEIKDRYKENGGTPSLDGNYTVFGQVYEGFDAIDKLSGAEVTDNGAGEKSKPVKDIIIKDITVSTFD